LLFWGVGVFPLQKLNFFNDGGVFRIIDAHASLLFDVF
jgi:hypothetical protein